MSTHVVRITRRLGRGGITTVRVVTVCALVVLAIPLLATASGAAVFSNPAPIAVPLAEPPLGCPPNCPSETAGPFPSTIAVSAVVGTVTDVNVTLTGLTYEQSGPPDADIMVVAPGGKAVMLMSDACGTNVDPNPISTPINLTFDDSASGFLPADPADACVGGNYKPIDDDDDGKTLPDFVIQTEDGFPGGPAAPASTLPLSTFNGISPNGTWSLYVVDDGPNTPNPNASAGRIAGGWSLSIEVNPAGTTTTSSIPSGSPAPSTTVVTCGDGLVHCVSPANGAATTTVPAPTSTAPRVSPVLPNPPAVGVPTTVAPAPGGATTVAPGDGVVVAGGGLTPNTTFPVTFQSTPVALGTITTNAQGAFSKVFTVPANATPGPHRIVISDSLGRELVAVALNVVKPGTGGVTPTSIRTGTLARTGAGSLELGVLGGIAVLIGGLALRRPAGSSSTWRR